RCPERRRRPPCGLRPARLASRSDDAVGRRAGWGDQAGRRMVATGPGARAGPRGTVLAGGGGALERRPLRLRRGPHELPHARPDAPAVRAARRAGEWPGRARRDADPARGRSGPARAGRTARAGGGRAARGARRAARPRARLVAGDGARRLVRPAALRAGHPRGGRVIDEKAQELGRLLGQSDEYKTLLRASDRMKADASCKQLLADVERIAQEIERATQEGREPSKEQVERYDRALQSVQANTVYQQVVAAQA